MARPSEIPTFDAPVMLQGDRTGANASPEDFGVQTAERMQELGGKIQQGTATLADIGEMHGRMAANQYVSTTMMQHKNDVDKYMADPKNYTDPKFPDNVQKMFTDAYPDMEKNAPNLLARKQLQVEFNEFQSTRMEGAFHTQTDVMLQKGYNDYALAPNSLLDNYRTNLKNPSVDAGQETFKQTDDLFKKIDASFGTVAPQMARELKDQVTSQMAYGVVNTNPDLAEKILNRGYLEGRTRHFLEDAIQTARGAQDNTAKQTAIDFSAGLLKKAEMFPDQVIQGPKPEYFEAHGFKPKEAVTMSARIQSQLDVNKDFATVRDSITGSDEQTLHKKVGDMYNDLKSSDPSSDKFNHDAMVLDRTQKFVEESTRVLHEDPVKYLSNYNREISSATQAYRDNPSQEKFDNLVNMQLRYQGPAPEGDTSGKYLNLPMHEISVMDKTQAEQYGTQILNSGPGQAGKTLHSIIQQYKPDNQGIALRDMVDHGKLPIEAYVMERTFGAPFSDKLNGAIMNAKSLQETVGRQKGSTSEDLDKLLDTNNTWLGWSKLTAADNFQRQDIVAGFRGAIQTYAMGMIQEGKKPDEAIKGAVDDLTQWGHTTVNVNGRSMQMQKNTFKGSEADFHWAFNTAMDHLDINRINLTDNYHRPIFPVAMLAGHEEAMNVAIHNILGTKLFPNMNPDGKSFSIYARGQENDFQLRDTSGKPITMQIADLPTLSYKKIGVRLAGSVTNWPSYVAPPKMAGFTPAGSGAGMGESRDDR